MTIRERLLTLIAQELGINENEIRLHHNFTNDLGADSLALVDLTMAVEAEFTVVISDDDAARMVKVGDVVEYLKKTTKLD